MYRLPLLTVLLLTTTVLFAQSSNDPSRVWLGVQAGLNLSTFRYDPEPPFDIGLEYRSGVAAGISFDYNFNWDLALTTELLYLQKGARSAFEEAESSVLFSYFAVPVLLKISTKSENVKPYLLAGVQLSAFLAGTQTTTSPSSGTRTEDVDYEEVTPFNVGVVAGAGIGFYLNHSTMIFIQGLFDYGLIDLVATESENSMSVYTKDIRVTAGISVALSKRPEDIGHPLPD